MANLEQLKQSNNLLETLAKSNAINIEEPVLQQISCLLTTLTEALLG